MLRLVSASIHLIHAHCLVADHDNVALLAQHTYSRQILHSESFAAVQGAEECFQLCALSVNGLNSLPELGSSASMPVYRSADWEEGKKDLSPSTERRLHS